MRNESVAKRYSVLVIDDQKNWRELFCEILEAEFNVTCAEDYASALAAIQRQNPPYHVVVTDMRLEDEQPGNEDGLKLAEYLNRSGNQTRTILVTGYSTVFTARKALTQLGAFDYIEKYPSDGPKMFEVQQFIKRVREAAKEANDVRPVQTSEKGITKYISAFVFSGDEQNQLLRNETVLTIHKPYTVKLILSDQSIDGAEQIVVQPSAEKNKGIRLELFIHGGHLLRVEQGTIAYWELPSTVKGRYEFEFSILPEFDGTSRIFMELKQDERLLVRISRTLNVTDGSSA